jgi:hypothetical protein
MEWHPPIDPPTDRVFMAVLSTWSGPVAAHWNAYTKSFCFAAASLDLVDGIWQDAYFENEYFNLDELTAWAEWPASPVKAA